MIGIDTVVISRIAAAVENKAFRNRVFTEAEQKYCNGKPGPADSYAGLFAAKEAVAKALGCGFGNGIMPTDVEITHDVLGAPRVVLHSAAVSAAKGRCVHVSISHDGDNAVGMAVLAEEKA